MARSRTFETEDLKRNWNDTNFKLDQHTNLPRNWKKLFKTASYLLHLVSVNIIQQINNFSSGFFATQSVFANMTSFPKTFNMSTQYEQLRTKSIKKVLSSSIIFYGIDTIWGVNFVKALIMNAWNKNHCNW